MGRDTTLGILIWLMVRAVKRAEVQVVQDDQETTYAIFKKLSFLDKYFYFVIAVLLVLASTIAYTAVFSV